MSSGERLFQGCDGRAVDAGLKEADTLLQRVISMREEMTNSDKNNQVQDFGGGSLDTASGWTSLQVNADTTRAVAETKTYDIPDSRAWLRVYLAGGATPSSREGPQRHESLRRGLQSCTAWHGGEHHFI